MKYIGLEMWNPASEQESFILNIRKNYYDKLIIFAQNEWQYWGIHAWDEILEEVAKQNKKLHVVVGAHKIFIDEPVTDFLTVDYWGTYHITKTFSQLYPKGLDYYTRNIYHDDYQFHYVTMNDRPHSWRCQIVDLLAKNDILKNGAVSWHHPKVLYNWRYFTPSVLKLDEYEGRNWSLLPDQYFNSFTQLISESTPSAIIPSEKTQMALIAGKPFLVASAPHFHSYLQELGFELFPELFDYSFDSVLLQTKRFEMLVDNFKRISTYSFHECKLLKEKIRGKLIHNHNRVREIAMDYNFYPEIAREIIDVHKTTGEVINNWIINVHETMENIKNNRYK